MTMTIAKNTVVTIKYRVVDTDGEVVDDGEQPLVYLHGGYGGIFEPIELALAGKTVGASVSVKLEPEDAFGEYDADLISIEDLSSFPEGIEVGMQVEGSPDDMDDEENDDEEATEEEDFDDDEDDEVILYTVTEITDGKVVLDGNHPLAGVALVFDATVTDVRPATAVEITHEHVHGEHGHHH